MRKSVRAKPMTHLLGGVGVGKPKDKTGCCRSHSRTRQTLLWLIQDFLKHILLTLTRNDESNSVRMVHHGVSECDSPTRGFGGIVNSCDPSIGFREKRMSREEGARVPVRTHTEQDEVENRESRSVHLCETLD